MSWVSTAYSPILLLGWEMVNAMRNFESLFCFDGVGGLILPVFCVLKANVSMNFLLLVKGYPDKSLHGPSPSCHSLSKKVPVTMIDQMREICEIALYVAPFTRLQYCASSRIHNLEGFP